MAKTNNPEDPNNQANQPAATTPPFDESVASPAEFSKIPLDFIIAAPLLTTIEAHKIAAQTTLEFVKGLSKEAPVTFTYTQEITDAQGVVSKQDKQITVPMLALTKVPSLNFDSLSVSFQYNISQVITEKNATKKAADAKLATKGVLAKFLNASLSGSIENTNSKENTVNRGGTLDIKLQVSESALPAGLQKVIDAMVEGISIPPADK